jgi:hypothetical protein
MEISSPLSVWTPQDPRILSLGERLAFVSPRIITAIIDGTAPAGITATTLMAGLSHSWAAQARWGHRVIKIITYYPALTH